jgi:N-dimethylarginine dimethylaminohydrolase
MTVYNSVGKLNKVLLCAPDYLELVPISEVAKRNIDAGKKVDHQLAVAEHKEMAQALESQGIEILWEKPHPDHPFQTFTRDIGTNTKEGPLIGRYRYPQREGDEDFAIAVFEEHDIQMFGRIKQKAFEGGDCYYLDDNTLVVGIGNRSTHEGVEEARQLLKPLGVEVLGVELEIKWNHLDMVFAMVTDKICLAVPEALPDYFMKTLRDKKFEIIEMTGEDSMNVYVNLLSLGEGKVLSFEQNKSTNSKLRSLGLEVFDPSLTQNIMGGGPHCLTFELERER